MGIRPDHRDFIMRGERAYGKSTFPATDQNGFVPRFCRQLFVVAHAVKRLNLGLL